ncbi:FHA domain-containing protein [Calothrix sp. PCC 7507]|uniref:FHA domain-containing protein n=1 Tax=Calothrix sp. PCC 7507 TaxID=99598 RepID=UPI00029EF281|nr:FHA domain-containing protein [Calothrix sp. PCC 7507]AFY35502.1 FHA domain containing protein [Calothrix sp. PCC 7507]
MQNLDTFNTVGLSLELFHVQTGTSFELPAKLSAVTIGKPNNQTPPDIDVSNLPNADVVSRTHAQIRLDGSNYFIEDWGSSNGTFLNDTKLEPLTPYQLNLGDKIDLGQGSQVTFIFQYKQHLQQNVIVKSNSTELQSQISKNSKQAAVNRNSRLIGMALMVAAIVILTANVQVGIFVRIPGILLCMAGIFVLFQRQFNHNIGWLLIALGIGVIVFTGNVFASVNLLVIVGTAALFIAGYQLFNYGNIFGYDLQSIKGLLKK